jgi:hypothetical protein
MALLAWPVLAIGCMTVFPVSATGKGCNGESADYFPAQAVVQKRAATELACTSGLQIEQRSDTEFTAIGCGQRQHYLCEADAVSGCSLDDAAEREGCRALDVSAGLQPGAG